MAYKDHGWQIYYAYADEEAGEIGTIYQALNWFYLGKGVGRDPGRKREYYKSNLGEVISERTLRRRKLKKSEIIRQDWETLYKEPKHKYVWFEGSKKLRKSLKLKCRYDFKDYPKKSLDLVDQIESSFAEKNELLYPLLSKKVG